MTRDLRRYAQQTNIHLLVGFLLLLFFVGLGLIWVFWGREAALMGLVCLLAGLAPLGLIVLALLGIDWAARRAKDE